MRIYKVNSYLLTHYVNCYFDAMFFLFSELIGTPNAPALVADSLTATSLSLFWEAPNLGNINYLVQWRYEELPGTWQYYSNTSHSNRSIIYVENLQPYTKYRVSHSALYKYCSYFLLLNLILKYSVVFSSEWPYFSQAVEAPENQ